MDDIDSSREEVHAFEPRKGHALLIGLFGWTGCGKTSLINSLKFAVSGRLRRAKWLQVAAQEKAGGHTMYRKLADLTESISVVDNRGLDNPNTEEAVKELRAQLGGERGFSEKVEWQERDDPQPVKCDALSVQPIGCAVLVFSALHDIEASIRGLDVLVETLYKYQGRYPICVITHVDVAPTDDTRELKNWLWYAGLTDVFDVANLTAEKLLLEAHYQCSLLSFLKRCIAYGDEGVARAEARGCERRRGGRHPRYENDHQHERQRRDVGEERGIQELRDKVAAYRPRREDNIYIGLFGRTGCGKTSLINSLKFAVSGRLRRAKWLQVAAQEKAGGHTMFRRLADITPSIYVIDNRGLDDPATPIAVTELDEQLSGERGYSHQIQWQERDSVEPAPRDHRSRHRISCAVLVFSALHDIQENITGLDVLAAVCYDYQDKYPIAVITHVDVAQSDDVRKLKEALWNSGLTDIFEVANLTNTRVRLEDHAQKILLVFLETCMTYGKTILAYTDRGRFEGDQP